MTDNDPQYHRLFPDDYDEALIAAAGAYMGTKSATGMHGDALRAAAQEAFNAGVKVGRENPDV